MARVAPGSAPAEALVAELLDDGRDIGPDRRRMLADGLSALTDARVGRHWVLLDILEGWPTWEASTPAVEWWIATLRTS